MDRALEARLSSLKTAAGRLRHLHAHDALLILKFSLSIPSLLHNLRSSFCCGHRLLKEFDTALRTSLSEIVNVSFDDTQWLQATLPVRDGGLGVRSCIQLAPSAFLASATGCLELTLAILPLASLRSQILLYTKRDKSGKSTVE